MSKVRLSKPVNGIGFFGIVTLLAVASCNANAGIEAFHAGTVIKDYGKIASVDATLLLPADMTYKVVFDMSDAAKVGQLSRSLESLARFINMHDAAGVKSENIQLAMVVHGGAVADFTQDSVYMTQHDGANNAQRDLIKQLTQHGVKIYLCGQSAAYYGVDTDMLLPGVDMALSAMTVHAVLAKAGYSLNPF